MKVIFKACLFFSFLFFFSVSLSGKRYPLAGMAYMRIPYENMTWQMAQDYVFFKDGFAIEDGLTRFGLAIPVHNDIVFKSNAVLELAEDLELGTSCNIDIQDTAGYISGNGLSIILTNDLLIEGGKSLEFVSDTMLDGHGNTIILGDGAQLIVDSNVTLTLKNLTLKSSPNMGGNPLIKTFLDSTLCLQNVVLGLDDNFEFNLGRLFVNGLVVVKGDGEFIYTSTGQCIIDSNSTLFFDIDTVFTYSPNSADRDLIVMRDSSSAIFLDGCNLRSTYTALRLTRGHLLFDNRVTVSLLDSYSLPASTFNVDSGLSFAITSTKTTRYNSTIWRVDWSPDGRFLLAGGGWNDGEGRARIYSAYPDMTIEYDCSVGYTGYVRSVAWSPNGKFIALGGEYGGEAKIYKIGNNGKIISKTTNVPSYNTFTIGWSPDNNFFIAGGQHAFDDGKYLRVYPFYEDGTLGDTTASFYSNYIEETLWSPDGRYLAVCGYDGSFVYQFNHDGTIGDTTAEFFVGRNGYAIAWSLSNSFLAVGGPSGGSYGVEVYNVEHDGSLSSVIASFYSGGTVYGLDWSPDERFLALGGNKSGQQLQVYSMDPSGSLDLVNVKNFACDNKTVSFVEWSPDNMSFAYGLRFTSNNYVGLYRTPYEYGDNYYHDYNFTSPGQYTMYSISDNAITFGNSALGSSYNLDVDFLSGAIVEVHGHLNIDNV